MASQERSGLTVELASVDWTLSAPHDAYQRIAEGVRRRRRRRRLAVVGGAAAGILAVISATDLMGLPAGSSPSARIAAGTEVSGGVSEGWLQKALKAQQNISITPLGAPVDGVISPKQAIERGRGDLAAAHGAPTALLVRLTDHAYGKEVRGRVRHPVFKGVIAYAVAFPHVQQSLFGPINYPAIQDGVGVDFVDARTGRQLESVTLNPPRPGDPGHQR